MQASHALPRRALDLVLAALVLGAASPALPAVITDFVAKAPEARWFRTLQAQGELPWNGSDSDSRGFVRHLANIPLENGETFALVLETHPEWKAAGLISGVYRNILIPANARFSATVGFLKDATATDGVTFKVFILDQATGAWQLLASKAAKADGVLDELAADLGPYAGKTVTFGLQVAAGGTATQDWAVWASAAIVSQEAALAIPKAPLGTRTVGAVQQPPAAQPGPTRVQKFQPAVIKMIPLAPVGAAPPKTKIEDAGSLPIEEPLTLLNHIYKDNEKPNTYYYLPREIDLIRDPASGDYRVSAVWTQDQKIRTTLTLQANIDPEDVKVMEEALRASKGSSALLKSMPYEEANIIDMKGWEDWQIEDIRIPTFGSLETELPVSIAMTPETLAQLKPLLEKEGLTAGMRIKTGEKEQAIPIKIGLKYFTGRWYSPLGELGFSYDERASLLTLHNVRNLSDFPLKVGNVSLRFRLPGKEEVYKNLVCDPEVTIPPGEFRDVKARLVLRDQLLAEYRKIYPAAAPPAKKKNPLGQIAMGILKSELDKKLDKNKEKGAEGTAPARSVPSDPKTDAFFKTYARSFWMDPSPDFDCQACLDKIWGSIEVVSYIERMRKVNVEVLANVFDPSAYETPREVEKLHLEIRSPYLSAQAKDGLMAAVDLTKDKLKDAITVYLPLANGETFSFEYKIKAVLKSGESAESADWEKMADSLDLTLGTFHVNKIFQK
ncbi:MAG TPA: hypothetical protein VLJ16_09995 [Acidobacteriota bacterium]|nr:hypothetical protein [Acidobacteriota bacterium]